MKKILCTFFLIYTIEFYCQNLIGPNHIIPFAPYPRGVVELDFDNDNDLDIIFYSEYFGRYYWIENENGEYYPYRDLGIESLSGSYFYGKRILVSDFDGDSKNDILIAEKTSTQNTLFRIYSIENETLVLENGWSEDNQFNELQLMDMNLDEKMDIVFSKSNKLYWLNNLSNFDFSSSIEINLSTAFIQQYGLADIDSDGDIDVITSRFSYDYYPTYYYWVETVLHLNDGAFNFTQEELSDEIAIQNMRFVDFDLDGDIDIVAQEYGYWSSPDLILVENDSMNFQMEEQSWPPISYFDIQELNGEEPLDIILFNTTSQDIEVLGLINDGSPEVVDTVYFGSFPNSNYGGPGLRVHEQSSFIFFNANKSCIFKIHDQIGNNEFALEFVSKKIGPLHAIQQADLDNDGDEDIYIKTEDGLIEIKNIGEGEWDMMRKIWDGGDQNTFVFADINEDGLLDIISKPETSEQLFWYENQGDQFDSNGIPISNLHQEISAFDFDDINNDGHVDFVYVAADNDQPILYVFMGQGQASFIQSDQVLNSLAVLPNQIFIVDFDNEPGKDIFTQKSEDHFEIYSLNYNGQVNNEYQLGASAFIEEFILADFNGDALIDVLYRTFINEQSRIYFQPNYGGDQFEFPEIILIENETVFKNLASGDLDGNGYQDLVLIEPVSFGNDNPKIITVMNYGNSTYDAFAFDYDSYGNTFNGTFIELLDIAGNELPEILVGFPVYNFTNLDWFDGNFTISNLSQESLIEFGVQLMPNPISDISTLDLGSLQHIENISILDARGRLIKELGRPNSKSIQINKENISKGIYFIKIETKDDLFTIKFTIE